MLETRRDGMADSGQRETRDSPLLLFITVAVFSFLLQHLPNHNDEAVLIKSPMVETRKRDKTEEMDRERSTTCC